MARTKRHADESVTVIWRELRPADMNSRNRLFGGKLLELMDEVLGVTAKRHARQTCVTAAIHEINIENPADQGNFLEIMGRVAYVGRTSITVWMEAIAEDKLTGERWPVASGFGTCVAINENNVPQPVAELELKTTADKELWEVAKEIRQRSSHGSKKS